MAGGLKRLDGRADLASPPFKLRVLPDKGDILVWDADGAAVQFAFKETGVSMERACEAPEKKFAANDAVFLPGVNATVWIGAAGTLHTSGDPSACVTSLTALPLEGDESALWVRAHGTRGDAFWAVTDKRVVLFKATQGAWGVDKAWSHSCAGDRTPRILIEISTSSTVGGTAASALLMCGKGQEQETPTTEFEPHLLQAGKTQSDRRPAMPRAHPSSMNVRASDGSIFLLDGSAFGRIHRLNALSGAREEWGPLFLDGILNRP